MLQTDLSEEIGASNILASLKTYYADIKTFWANLLFLYNNNRTVTRGSPPYLLNEMGAHRR